MSGPLHSHTPLTYTTLLHPHRLFLKPPPSIPSLNHPPSPTHSAHETPMPNNLHLNAGIVKSHTVIQVEDVDSHEGVNSRLDC